MADVEWWAAVKGKARPYYYMTCIPWEFLVWPPTRAGLRAEVLRQDAGLPEDLWRRAVLDKLQTMQNSWVPSQNKIKPKPHDELCGVCRGLGRLVFADTFYFPDVRGEHCIACKGTGLITKGEDNGAV
jgi:hypothetical protein